MTEHIFPVSKITHDKCQMPIKSALTMVVAAEVAVASAGAAEAVVIIIANRSYLDSMIFPCDDSFL